MMLKSDYLLKRFALIAYLAVCLSMPLGARADDRAGMVGGTPVLWDLTPAQAEKADALLTASRVRQQMDQNSIKRIHENIGKLFLQPTPDQAAILALQSQQDVIKAASDANMLKTNLEIRRSLTPEQRQWLGLLKPSEVAVGIELTPGQVEKYHELMRPYLQLSLTESKQRVNLALDQTILLQEMDLAHACHVMNLDESALVANQKQIDALDVALAKARLQVAIGLHNLLSDKQKQMLTSGAGIRVPDPNAARQRSDRTKSYPSPAQVYEGVTLSAQQKASYNSLMSDYVAQAERTGRIRDGLVAQRRDLLSRANLDEAALAANQQKINQIDEESSLARIHLIVTTRDVLTQEQRHALFNRHHPKIWNDTGLDTEQDKKIMAIHMKIEEADQVGRRKMNNLAQDILALYFDQAPNDDQILAAQRDYDQAEAETIHKQLVCLFENRTVLTEAQRQKLVQLMQVDNQPAH